MKIFHAESETVDI